MTSKNLAVLCVFLLRVFLAGAQTSAANGTIGGIVLDPQAVPVTGASVSLLSADEGFSREATVTSSGKFILPALPAGSYILQVHGEGLETRRPVKLTLGLNANLRLTLKLSASAAESQMTVRSGSPTQEGNTVLQEASREEADLTTSLAGLTVTYLPSRDRELAQLTQQTIGVAQAMPASGWVMLGQRASQTSGAVDGAELRDPFYGGLRGAQDSFLFFPQTVVREVEVVQAGASSEVGRTSAGFLSVATKSGTDKFKGEAFYVGRVSAFTSPDAFGRSLDNAQSLFGASAGGPIRKGRTYYYTGFEQDFMNVPYWVTFEPQASGVLPETLKDAQGEVVSHMNAAAFFGRIDTVLNEANVLTAQFNFNHFEVPNLSDGSTRTARALENKVNLRGDAEWARAGLISSSTNQLVNQALLQWSRDARSLSANSTAPERVINGFGILGGNALEPQVTRSYLLQIKDDVALMRGATIIHAGGSFLDAPAYQARVENPDGRYDYDSLPEYLAARPRRFQQTFFTNRAIYDASVHGLGLYVVAKTNLAKGVVATVGVRWDGQWNPQPGQNGISQSRVIPNDMHQWQPRAGLALSMNAKTTVRASTGFMDAPTPAAVFQRIFVQNGVETFAVDSYFDPQVLVFQSPLSETPTGINTNALAVGIDKNYRNPRSLQTMLSVERQIHNRATVSATYVHASTWALQRMFDRNLAPPVTRLSGLPVFLSPRPDAAIGRLLVNESSAHSGYDGLLITANMKLPKRSFFTANYTFAKTLDDDSMANPYDRQAALNPFEPSLERSDSALDVRHDLNLNAIVNLPLGFKINPLLVARSALPYTPLIGLDLQNDANDWNDRAFLDGSIASRNTLRQPGFYNLDFRFVKDITLRGEGHHLDLFMDIFNITGASNRSFGSEGISIFGTPSSPVFSGGQALNAPDTTRFGGARQIQFTARLVGF